MYEEDSSVSGDFEGIKSVKQIDGEKGKGNGTGKNTGVEVEERSYNYPLIILNLDGTHKPFRPVSELRAFLEGMNAVYF